MRGWMMWRKAQIALLTVGLACQASPIAWAQLETVDPALHAAVEALVANDPELINDPELSELCRQVAEATVVDPRERAAVTNEVAALQREGVDVSTVIPPEVREAAREQWTRVQGEMQAQVETLRATDPDKAREIELMMREGERTMQAFENGEKYTPSPEMVSHAEGMFKDWEADMAAQGAPPEYLEAARVEFARWSGGETTGMMGGPGHEMMGPGHDLGGPGGMPSVEQMQAMVDAGQMTPEQLQMATEYMQGGFESYQAGMEAYHAGMEYGQQMEQQYMEQMAHEYNYTPPENQTYDTLQQQHFETLQSPTPAPAGPHTLVQDNPPGQPDGWDNADADNLVDHTHSEGTAPH